MELKKKHYRAQVDMYDCGVASLAMILSYYGSYYSLATLRESAKTNNEGTTALGLLYAANIYELETKAIKADMSVFDEEGIPFPFIAHVLKNGKLMHYYVVTGSDEKNIYIADPDPSVKMMRMSRERFKEEWSGIMLLMSPGPNYQIYQEERNSLISFIPLIVKQSKLVTKIILLSLSVTVINIIGTYYLQSAIDTYIPNHMNNMLEVISIGLVISYILQQILQSFQECFLAILNQCISKDIILNYINHIFHLPMSFFATRRTGEILSRFTDTNVIIDALSSSILSIFLDISTVMIISFVLFSQNLNLFLLSLIILPIYSIIIISFVKAFEKMNQNVMEANAILSSSIIEDINGIETIKSLTSEEYRYKKINQEFIDFLEKSYKYIKVESIQRSLKKGFQLILNIIILWFGAKLVMSGKMTLGQLITYNMLLSYFTAPLENIINLQTKIQKAHVSNERLNEVYLVKSEADEQKKITNLSENSGEIIFKDLDYSYGYGEKILSNVNLKIENGSKIVFVGPSGSGKSTIAKLIVNFLEPNNGSVFLGNININQISKNTLREYINYLPQQPYIFTGTILDNILLGSNPKTKKEDVLRAVELAEIKEDIEKMPLNFHTEITSDGFGISGGQRQRIALARALLTDSSILILDEATSSLDNLTEQKIIKNLLELDKTIIFIAHRLKIAEYAERIIVLEKGNIVEEGNHKELLKKKGYYSKLINS